MLAGTSPALARDTTGKQRSNPNTTTVFLKITFKPSSAPKENA
jgi:hypothetical protein